MEFSAALGPLLLVLALIATAGASLVGRSNAQRPSVPAADAVFWRWLAAGLLVGAALWVTASAGRYGYNVDEWIQTRHAEALYDWYRRLFSEGHFAAFESRPQHMNHYGGLFETLLVVGRRALPGDPTTARHLLTGWAGVAGAGLCYLLGATLHSRAAGFGAALLLLLTPRYMGEIFNNTKDVPFAVAMTAALLAICRCLDRLPRPPLGQLVLIGAGVGAAAAIRVGGLLALVYFAAALLWWLARSARSEAGLGRALPGLAMSGIAVVGIAWLVMLAFWPWAISDPLLRPVQAAGLISGVAGEERLDFRVLFEGRYTRLVELPNRFTLQFLAISAPEFALLAPLLALPLLGRLRGAWRLPGARGTGLLLCALAVVLPLCFTASDRLIQFDGIRHFLFVVPPLAVLFAAALVEVLRGGSARAWKASLATGCLLLAALCATDMARLHPYEYTYFNRTLGGGVAAASQRYDTEYMGLSYREGMRWLVDHYEPAHEGEVRISGCPGYAPNLRDALDHAGPGAARFRLVRRDEDPHVSVAATLVDCHRLYRGRRLATIGRAGAPFLHVMELRRRR